MRFLMVGRCEEFGLYPAGDGYVRLFPKEEGRNQFTL